MLAQRMRIIVMAKVIVVALCLLSACTYTTPTPEPVTVRFACPNTETERYRQLADAFNQAYPWITVEIVSRDYNMFSGMDPGGVDVFVSTQFALNWLREGDRVFNLTPFVEQDTSFHPEDFFPGTLNLYTADGKIWGVPASIDVLVMYYNRELFDRYGVPYPVAGWTWEDFLAKAAALRDETAGVYGYVANFERFDPIVFIYQHGGRIFDDLQNPTRTTFDDPLTIEALEWYLGLLDFYNVAPTPPQVRGEFGGRIERGILAGKVGMWTGMLGERGGRSWPTKWEMQWGVVPLPRDQRAATLTLINGYFIAAKTPYPDASWKWVVFLSQQLPGSMIPPRRSLLESVAFSNQVGADVAQVARDSMEGALLLSPDLAEFEGALEVFGKAVEQILAGAATPEEAMRWAQRQFDLGAQ